MYTYRPACGAVLLLLVLAAVLGLSACSPSHKAEVDRLNELSYAYHYRNLDSTRVLAQRALSLAGDYPAGYAEACNNMAFVAIVRMRYAEAKRWLACVEEKSDNQIEILIADVQYMRLCQRQSRNKDFYAYREKAMQRLHRIGEEADYLSPRERKRVLYAHSEFSIVDATYFYYVGLEKPMVDALADIDVDELEQDTAQYLNYLYNIGAGGFITRGTSREINQEEFDNLMRCYIMASGPGPYPFWQANSLQALSEHLQKPDMRDFLIKNNQPAIKYVNVEQMPDSLLAGNLAQRALNLFVDYGDVYQMAGGYRTLAECYWAIGDYRSAEQCLTHALYDHKAIKDAPDMVASIREQMCLVYSAVDDKPKSDYNRNVYLDLQEQTRQDRLLEARAALLDDNLRQLNLMIGAVVGMIVVVTFLLFLFDRMRRKNDRRNPLSKLLEPLQKWKERNRQQMNLLAERHEEIDEASRMGKLHVADNRRRNLEQRAKVALVNSIMPFIDRMMNEVQRLSENTDSEQVKRERFQYLYELTEKINQYNQVLTQWIQMRQGSLSLKIESFALQPLFDMVSKGKMSFAMKGVRLEVRDTDAVVKADRTLTLFMINTIADNARKFTPRGGVVVVSARQEAEYVEVEVADTGKGMDAEQLSHVFDRTYTGGHGFGLLNCKGIIEKYKKLSSLFAVCSIQATSKLGEGSRFSFRLPRGVLRLIVLTCLFTASLLSGAVPMSKKHHQHEEARRAWQTADLLKAGSYADSAYFSNINARYTRTLQFADSARYYLNQHYLKSYPGSKTLMVRNPNDMVAAEIKWYHDSVATNYGIILDIRNEIAVAALALHEWNLYHNNNKVYTQLFREQSADNTLADYVRTMQVSENSKTVAVVLLILLLLLLPLAYYFLYYRHILNYRFAVAKVGDINKILLSDAPETVKLQKISQLWDEHESLRAINGQLSRVVEQIEQTLRESIAAANAETVNIELAEDELRRTEYENAQLHISNSVLDNCLSTLKHETMYYPSRIRQLVETHPTDVEAIRELVDYYKSLYAMLSHQAMEQVERNIKVDRDMLSYLFSILRKEGGGQVVEMCPKDQLYECYRVEMPKLHLSQEECNLLFTPLTVNLKFLLCRQIVREIGEVTNLRGAGIQAVRSAEGRVMVEVVLPKKIATMINQ